MYYNTNNLKDETLSVAETKTERQEQKIRKLFGKFHKMTPSDVFHHFQNTPITSVRRGITNLKNEGLLEKTSEMKQGIFGSPEHYYKLKFQETLF